MALEKVSARNEDEMWNNLYAKRLKAKQIKPKLKVGDRIRLNKKFRTFQIGCLPSWIEQVFDCSSSTRLRTHLQAERGDGTPLCGTFYAQDLQKANVTDDDPFRLGQVVKRKGDKVLVRW